MVARAQDEPGGGAAQRLGGLRLGRAARRRPRRARRRPPRPRAAWRPRAPTARRTRRATCRPRSASAPAALGSSCPARLLKPVTGFSVRPVLISSRATATGSCLPALPFQITNPQPGSSRDPARVALGFSLMSRPQTGHGPSLARGIRTSFSFASSSPTVDSANLTMSPMNALRESGAGLDLRQPALPVAGQLGARQRMAAEQADHVQALLGDDQRAAVALDVADLEQPLDDRRTRRRRADPVLLHRLAQLLVVDELAGGLHRGQQRASV